LYTFGLGTFYTLVTRWPGNAFD